MPSPCPVSSAWAVSPAWIVVKMHELAFLGPMIPRPYLDRLTLLSFCCVLLCFAIGHSTPRFLNMLVAVDLPSPTQPHPAAAITVEPRFPA